MKHYIAMGGLYGCLPDNCSAYKTKEDAIGGLNCIYELEDDQIKDLESSGHTNLTQEQGGQYCEVLECDCNEPWEHDEFGEKQEWMISNDEEGEK